MPSNPYTTIKGKPLAPPAPPPKSGVEVRGEVGGTYHCAQCLKEHVHTTGYMWVAIISEYRMYFCNVMCYETWLKANPEVRDSHRETPAPDRRGAIAATKAKNEEKDLRT